MPFVCMLIAARGWDVNGAIITGMRTAFLQLPGKALYALSPDVELKGKSMDDIAGQLPGMTKSTVKQ